MPNGKHFYRRLAWGLTCLLAAGAFAAEVPPLRLVRGVVDTRQSGPEGWLATQLRADPAALFAQSPQTPGRGGGLPVLVQFEGPVTDGDRAQLRAAGAEYAAAVPAHACLVSVAPDALGRVTALPRVRWIGEWHPRHKIEPALRERVQADASALVVSIQTLTGQAADEIAQAVTKAGGEVLARGSGGRFGLVRARLPASSVEAMAAQGPVLWIERYIAPTLQNDRAVAGDRMNLTNLWNLHGLTGVGQIVGHADTGLDIGTTNGIHPDFADRVVYAVGLARGPLGRGGKWDDPDGHGTHTAGSILGSGAASGGQYRGVAFDAKLVHQSVIDKLGLLTGIPAELHDLFHEAYTNGARVHSDSWGASVAGRYDTEAAQCDDYMWRHPDMLLVFAASNDGHDGDANGIIDFDSLGSPGTAKNLLCVGAAESGRPPGSGGYSGYTYGSAWGPDYPVPPVSNDFVSASPPGQGTGMAAFSSRGPTDDGRIKPDIVAPGTDIISTRSHNPKAGVAWGALAGNTNYMFSGGTSMSTPLTAGAAALVRQYFTDVAGMSNLPPSAALIKAALLNGARSLSPGQYGTGPAREIPPLPRPNPVEGWGHVDLEESLFPAAPVRLTYKDWETLSTGETNLYSLTVTGASRLTLTLAYSDFPGFAGSGRALVNDLDLVLIGPGGVTNRPNGLTAADSVNNVEGIDVDSPAPGLWQVRVTGHDVPEGPQPYALVARGDADLTGGGQALRLEQVAFTVNEPAGGLDVSVIRSGGLTGTLSVDLQTSNGTALATQDYVGTNVTLVFAPGTVKRTATLALINDADDELPESFTLLLVNPQGGAALVAPTSAVVNVLDDDGPGALQFNSPSYITDENAGLVEVTVQRLSGSAGEVSVAYATSNGTALAGADYTAASGTLVFTNGEVERQFSVTILEDAAIESAESFCLRLSNPLGGATLGGAFTAAVVIAASDLTNVVLSADFDDGLPPGWSVVANGIPAVAWRFDDPGGRGNLTGGSNGFAIADSDFAGAVDMDTELRTPLLDLSNLENAFVEVKLDFKWWFLGGEEVIATEISTNGAAGPWTTLSSTMGASLRGPRTVKGSLGAVAGLPSVMLRFHYFNARADWWIQIDDVRIYGRVKAGPASQNLRFSAPQFEAGETDGVAVLTVERSGDEVGTVSVDFATGIGSALPGVDFVPTNGSLEFAEGVTTNTIAVALLDDGMTESPLDLPVMLSNPTNPGHLIDPTQAVVHILDNDAVVVARLRADFNQGLPPGWTVVANGDTQAVWRLDDPAARTNQTGGSGGFAIADSAHYLDLPMDTELRSPPLDFAVFETVTLAYRQDFNWYRFDGDELADVDVSTNGSAGPWELALRLAGAEVRGPMSTNIDLTMLAAGHSNVSIRFRYHEAVHEFWWQVDDFECAGAVAGGNRDADGDGLQDWWEAFYFANATNAAGAEDSDADGMRNDGEYVAGTDPRDAADVLRIRALVAGTNAIVSFTTVSGHVYRLLESTNLLGGWEPGTNVEATGDSMAVGGPSGADPVQYYRIEVLP